MYWIPVSVAAAGFVFEWWLRQHLRRKLEQKATDLIEGR